MQFPWAVQSPQNSSVCTWASKVTPEFSVAGSRTNPLGSEAILRINVLELQNFSH